MKAGINLITGPMFSGKSTRLLAEFRAWTKSSPLLLVPERDTRSGAAVKTHPGDVHPATVIGCKADFWEAVNAASPDALIFIDEAQFFGDWLPWAVRNLYQRGRCVTIAGLAKDAHDRPFGPMAHLLCLATCVTVLPAQCELCHKHRAHSTRLRGGSLGEDQIKVGGEDLYYSICQECETESEQISFKRGRATEVLESALRHTRLEDLTVADLVRACEEHCFGIHVDYVIEKWQEKCELEFPSLPS